MDSSKLVRSYKRLLGRLQRLEQSLITGLPEDIQADPQAVALTLQRNEQVVDAREKMTNTGFELIVAAPMVSAYSMHGKQEPVTGELIMISLDAVYVKAGKGNVVCQAKTMEFVAVSAGAENG